MENNKAYKIFRIAVLGVSILVEILWNVLWGLMILAFLTDQNNFISLAVMLYLDSILIIAISICGIYRCIKNKKIAVISTFIMKLYSMCITIILWIPFTSDDILRDLLFTAMLLFIFVGALVIVEVSVKRSRKKKEAILPEENYFGFDPKTDIDAATDEYCILLMTTKQKLDSMSLSAANDFAYIPSAYIVIWMIRHGFVIDRDGKINELTGILKTNYMMGDDPVISLKSYTGCRLRIEDISPEIVPFAKNYFSRLPPFPIDASRRMYIFDYYDIVRNKDHRYYCVHFSWKIYRQIEKRINEAYFSFSNRFEPSQYKIPSVNSGSFDLFRFGGRTAYTSAYNVPFGYVSECMTMLNRITPAEMAKFAGRLASACGLDKSSGGRLISGLRPLNVVVAKPLEKGRGCNVYCECDSGRYHPVLTVRDGMVLHVTCAGDESSPWSYISDMRYKLRRSAADTGIEELTTREELEKAAADGTLWKVPLTPDSENDTSILTTPYAAILKSHCDMMIECLNVRGVSTDYRCLPEYEDENSPARRLHVTANDVKTNRPVFIHTIDVY